MLELQELHKGVFIIDDFLSDEECDQFIQKIDEDQLKENRMFSHVCNFYNNKQIDPELAKFFWDRITNDCEDFPKEYTDLKGVVWKAEKPSHFIATTHYTKSQHFGLHTDTGIFDVDRSECKK